MGLYIAPSCATSVGYLDATTEVAENALERKRKNRKTEEKPSRMRSSDFLI